MVISAAVHYSVPRRYSNPNPHQAFSLVQQHELDGPLLSEEALELQVGTRRTSLGSRMLVIKAVVVNVHLLSAGRQREAQGGGCLLGQAPGGRRRRAAAAAPLCEGRDRRPRAGEPHPPPSPSPLTAHLSPFTLTLPLTRHALPLRAVARPHRLHRSGLRQRCRPARPLARETPVAGDLRPQHGHGSSGQDEHGCLEHRGARHRPRPGQAQLLDASPLGQCQRAPVRRCGEEAGLARVPYVPLAPICALAPELSVLGQGMTRLPT